MSLGRRRIINSSKEEHVLYYNPNANSCSPTERSELPQKHEAHLRTNRTRNSKNSSLQKKVVGSKGETQGSIGSGLQPLPTPSTTTFLPLTRDNKEDLERLSQSQREAPANKSVLQEWDFVNEMGRKYKPKSRYRNKYRRNKQ